MNEFDDLIKPHIDSFECFLDSLPTIVSNIPPLELKYEEDHLKIYIEEIIVNKPYLSNREYMSLDRRLLPKECRHRLETYKGKVKIKYAFVLNKTDISSHEKSGGHVPIMIKSSLCHLKNKKSEELGGYFIINGLEKAFRFLVVPKRNFIFALIKGHFQKRNKALSKKCVSMRCVGPEEIGLEFTLNFAWDGNVYLRLSYNHTEYYFPIISVLKALTNISDVNIFTRISEENNELLNERILTILRLNLQKSIDSEVNLNYRKQLFNIFNSKNEDNEDELIEKLFSLIAIHLESKTDKVNFLLEALKKLFKFVNDEISADDQDDPTNHEIIGVNYLLSIIARDKLTEGLKMTKKMYEKNPIPLNGNFTNILKLIDHNILNRLESFLASGTYNTYECSDIKQSTGFVIYAERVNFLRFLSHFRCINRGNYYTNIKTTSIRKLRPESYGFLCPVHTPDGTPCGILNHLASDATIVFNKQSLNIKFIYELGVSMHSKGLPVFIDGKLIGFSTESQKLAEEIRKNIRNTKLKNALKISIEVAYLPNQGVFVFSNVGRYSRKIYNKISKQHENIGIMEQLFYNKNNYLESKTGFLSIVAGLTPFSDYNQSPRNMYQCQMAKQSMGVSTLDLRNRIDTKSYLLFYNQIPIVQTDFYKKYNISKYPSGINAVVAILSYTAYDMEDAMVINKSALERGFFRAFVYKSEVIEFDSKFTNYKIVEEGEFLTPGSFFYSYTDTTGNKVKLFSGLEGGFVEQVNITATHAIIKLRVERNPNIGDKFCSRHGQKGVCSFHYPQNDLPFTESGLTPDIIINPHAFPSRMTIGMMLESLGGKSGCLLGKTQGGTPFLFDEQEKDQKNFTDKNSHLFGEELKKCNFSYFGNETMYSGVTGSPFTVDVYIGVVYYQRLRHMVNDKYQVRIQGPVQQQTRQPIKGRSKLGGVRLGEMERDALLAHSTPYILQDRLINCSDGTLFYYCIKCKNILFSTIEGCECGNKVVKEVYLPYVYKYLCTELMAVNIRVKIW